MKNHKLLTLLALVLLLLASSAAGSARASVLTSRPELQILPTWTFYGDVQGVQMGHAVAGAGLVNGDAYADVLVGAQKGGDNQQGWVGLFLGSGSGLQSTPVWEIVGDRKGDLFGGALDGGADVNHDGYDDIVVGAENYRGVDPSDEAGEGAVYVYYGASGGPATTPAWKVEGDIAGVGLGASVALGYINGDDYADVIVGMPGYDSDLFENVGAAFVYFGSADGPNLAYGWLDIGGQAGGQFGLEVNAAGDVNGDGYGDVLVGEPYFDKDDLYHEAGAVYLYLGTQYSMTNVHAWSYTGYRGGDHLGTSVASAGDLNNDGCDDIAIGAPGYNSGGLLDVGRVYVFYGCQGTLSGLNSEPDWEYSFVQEGANFGTDVSSAGDTNNDGYDELLVGADTFNDEQANEGAIFAFFGSAIGIAPQPVWRVEGNKNDTDFGFAVDGAGDTNGDGFADVIVGAPTFRIEEENRGAAFVFLGSPEEVIIHYVNYLPFIRR